MIESAPPPEWNRAIPSLMAVFESLPDAHLILLAADPQFTILAVNAAFENFFDLNYPPELAARLHLQLQQVIDTRTRISDETAYTGSDGAARYYEYSFVPLFAICGTVEAVAGSNDLKCRNPREVPAVGISATHTAN